MAGTTPSRTVRLLVLATCAIASGVLLASIARQSWTTNSRAADVVALESQGAAILHPMTTLLGELVAAQSAAVRGEAIDVEAIRTALAGVAELDQEYGTALQTHQRLVDLTAQAESAFDRGETGRAAYETYTGLVTLAVALIRQVGDTSHLIHDPDLDSYYLMEAAIIRLPDAMVLAGMASDLVALAGGRTLQGEDAVKAAVARFGVSAAADQVSAGLNRSVDFTSRSALGTNIAERLDAFRAAADAFAPPTMLAELAGPVDAASLAANARRVYAAANPLAHRLLSELQALLDVRAAKFARERLLTASATGVIALIWVGMFWLLGRTRPGVVGGQAGPASARAADTSFGSLTSARDLLGEDELVGTARAVRTRARGRGDAQ